MDKARISNRQVEAFLAVAECNSFTAAAQRLELTTSAVSSLVAELEKVIGIRLFERSTRRVVLNDAGRQFLPSALAFYRTLREIERAADALGDSANDTVRVAAPMVIASAILPRFIAEFQAEHPGREVVVIDTGVEWLAERVANGEADFAVGPDRATSESVQAEELAPSTWVVWLSPEHELAKRAVLKWRDLRGTKFHAAGHDHERIVEQAMSALPEEDRIIPGQVFNNISTAFGMASANLGISFCPAYVAPLAKAFNLEMRRVVDPEFTRYVMLYSPASKPLTAAANAFANLLRRRFKEVSASPDS